MKYRKQLIYLTILIILLFTINSASAHVRSQYSGDLDGTYNYEDNVFYAGDNLELRDGYAISLNNVNDETSAVFELTRYGNHVLYFDVKLDETITKYHDDYAFDIKYAGQGISSTTSSIETGEIISKFYSCLIDVDITISKIGIFSNPSDANIYIDDVYKGQTGSDWMYVEDISFGTHLLEMTKSGYDNYIATLDVSSDNKGFVNVELIEIVVEDVVEEPVEAPGEAAVEALVEEEAFVPPPPEAPVEAPVEEEAFVPPPPESKSIVSIIIGGLLIMLLFFGIIIKKSKKSNELDAKTSIQVPTNTIEEGQNILIKSASVTKSINTIEVKSAFSYKGATILYKIKVENPTPEPIGDIKVNLYVPDVFLVSESAKTIAMLKPSESKTATFEIRPTGECGDCEVSGKVVYYDYSTKKTSEIEIPAKNLSIVCPMLHSKEISEDTWRNALSGFAKAEESTKEIEMPASTLFDITTDILQDMNLYMLEPKINDSSNLYRAVAKFYGEGVKELKYAAQIEVVGGAKKSKLILKSWAEREDALTGFYHGVLDEIEKRVNVKRYINDNIVQNFNHHGDNIGTQVKDSLVQRSNIGTGEDVKKCPNCKRDVNANEKFCLECGTQIE